MPWLCFGNSLVALCPWSTSEMPKHTHEISQTSLTGFFSADGGRNSPYIDGSGIVKSVGSFDSHERDSDGEHWFGRTFKIDASHTHTIDNAGGGEPYNNLQPYEVVYRWKRVA